MLPGVDGTLYLISLSLSLPFFHPRLRFNPNTRGPPKLHSLLLVSIVATRPSPDIQIMLHPFLTTRRVSSIDYSKRERERIFDLFVGFDEAFSGSHVITGWMRVIFSRKCEKVSRIRRAEEISWVAVI